MRGYLLPFGDFIGSCLIPNHFHWLFYVKKVEVPRKELWQHVDEVEFERRLQKYGEKAISVRNHKQRKNTEKPITLNHAIGSLEKSYSKAFNKETEQSGSLFRAHAKAKDGWIDEFVTLKKGNGKTDFRFIQGNDYGFQCLSYIHENTDWKFSSAKDYAGLRNGTLCNLALGRNLLNFI